MLTGLQELIRQTGLLLILRAGPQDIPYSTALLRLSVAVYVGLAALSEVLVHGLLMALVQGVLVAAATGGFIVLVLQFKRRAARSVQTLTAYFAAQSVLAGMQMPAAVSLAPIRRQLLDNPELLEQAQPPAIPALPALAAMLLFVWSLMVVSHIFRHALDVNTWLGLGLAIAQIAAAVVVVSAIVG